MDYLEVKISMPQGKVDLVSTFLCAMGYDTFEIRDYSDLIENAGQAFYDYIEDDLIEKQNEDPAVFFYLEKEEEEKAGAICDAVKAFADREGHRDITASWLLVQNSDWDTKWKEFFKPFPVGKRLFVNPAWEENRGVESGDRAVLLIDPAAAFGSGAHATTRMCLESVDRAVKGGEKTLDMGCGSGILGIAALKLGADSVTAVDIDQTAVRTARENFEKNGCDREKVRFLCGNVLSDAKLALEMGDGFDLIFANIVAQIIREMAPILYRALKPGGTLFASGILEERCEEVKQTLLETGFTVVKKESAEEWVLLELKK